MVQTKDRSGDKETYRYGDFQLEILPYFLYEVNLYRIFKNRSDLISTRYYKSDKFLKINECKVVKQLSNFKIVRFIDLIGSPEFFVKENYLSKFELLKNKKHEKRKN